MNQVPLELTPEMRAALSSNPGAPLHIADQQTRKVYLLVEQGMFPELEEEFVRGRLEEGFAAAARGEEEAWDSESTKAEGRQRLGKRDSQ